MVLPRNKSPNYTLTLRLLEEGDLTYYLLAADLGIELRNAREYLKLAKREGKAHVDRWEKHGQFGNGPPVPTYRYGEGEDAPRLAPMTGAEAKRKQRSDPLRRVERRWRHNERTTTDQ